MVNKLIICVSVLIGYQQLSTAQIRKAESDKSYHFIYLDVSRINDRQNLTLRLIKVLDQIYRSGDDFLLYLSNGYKPELISSQKFQKQQQNDLISTLQTLKTSSPILTFDRDTIFRFWDQNDITAITPDNKIRLLFRNIYLYYFVSSDFFKLEEKELIDRFLLIKDLTRKHIDPQKITINILYSKDDSKIFVEREAQISRNNITGYKYIFSSY